MMGRELSPNTQAILLLTAPLLGGRGKPTSDPLTAGEYKRLARHLRASERQPADLLGAGAVALLKACRERLDGSRLEQLLGRGFLLSQAVERWQTRSIWVVSRADSDYPKRFKKCLGEDAPPVLYGCGEAALLDTGGLAVVGSRDVDDELIAYTEAVGRLAAESGQTIVSGGARGIDQAAMRGASEAHGRVVGVLADSLERAAMRREHREALMDGHLVVVSPYDPTARFHVGHAMQRNKLIYALADAALVVSADLRKGGTWAGAEEQLEKLRFTRVYVRSTGDIGPGLEALGKKGARPWPNPASAEELKDALQAPVAEGDRLPEQKSLLDAHENQPRAPHMEEPRKHDEPAPPNSLPAQRSESSPAEELFGKVRELLGGMTTPKTEAEVAEELQVSKAQAREWLKRLVEEGAVEKLSRPVRYRSAASVGSLFDRPK
jgi:DNA processing protein